MLQAVLTKNKAIAPSTLRSFFPKYKHLKLAKQSTNISKEKILFDQESKSNITNNINKINLSNSKRITTTDNSSNNIIPSTHSSISKKKLNSTSYRWNTYKKNSNVGPSSTSVNFFKKNSKNYIKKNNFIKKNKNNSKNIIKRRRDCSVEEKYELNTKLFKNFIGKFLASERKIFGGSVIKNKYQDNYFNKKNNEIKVFNDLPYLDPKNHNRKKVKSKSNSKLRINVKNTNNYKQNNLPNQHNERKPREYLFKKNKTNFIFTIKDYNNFKNGYNSLMTYSNIGNNKNEIFRDSNTQSKNIKINSDNFDNNSNLNSKNIITNSINSSKPQIINENNNTQSKNNKINSDNYSDNSNLNTKNIITNSINSSKPQIINENNNKESTNLKTTRTDSTEPKNQIKKNLLKQENIKENQNILVQNIDFTKKIEELCKYDIGENIGIGAYAVVKIITDRVTKENFAMKVYDKSKLSDNSTKKCAYREIEILKRVNHKNIVKLFGIIYTDTKILIIQELVKGISLREYYNREIRDQKEISEYKEEILKKIFYQIFDAMNYIHKNFIAHRDIKLENILMTKDYEIKIIDFGFGMYNPENKLQTFYCGTPNYMPPEITFKKPYNGQKADLWSLGVLVYKMFCADFPFKGKTKKELYENIQSGKFNIASYVPENVKNVIIRMIEINPNNRMTCENVLKSEWLRDYEE